VLRLDDLEQEAAVIHVTSRRYNAS
jgi:hypothetical protein